MTQKYLRICQVTFTGAGNYKPSSELKLEFEVEKNISGIPNTGTVKLWNLAPANRYAVGKEYDGVTLEVGYVPSGMAVVLQGKIREVFHDPQKEDTVTVVSVGDGDKAEREGFVAKTFKPGTSIKDIVQQIHADGMPGITLGELKGLDELPAITRPLTLVKPTRKAMDEIARTHNLYWSYQNETLETIPRDGYLNQITIISAKTGMVGTPTITDNGIVVKTLMDTSIRPNRVVEVISKALQMNDKGKRYRVSSVKYTGGNRDNEYFTEVTGENLNGEKVG